MQSAKELECRPAEALKVSRHTPGNPRQNVPERWEVAGSGGEFRCSSYLLTSGAPAHTECTELRREPAKPRVTDAARRKLAARLERASVQRIVETTRCKADQITITGRLVEGSAQIYLLRACGQAYRCLTLGAGSDVERPTRCEELTDDKQPSRILR